MMNINWLAGCDVLRREVHVSVDAVRTSLRDLDPLDRVHDLFHVEVRAARHRVLRGASTLVDHSVRYVATRHNKRALVIGSGQGLQLIQNISRGSRSRSCSAGPFLCHHL